MTRKKSTLGQSRIKQPIAGICLDLFARHWNYERIQVELHEKYGTKVEDGDLRLLMANNHEELLRRRAELRKENAVSATTIKEKAELLLDMRLSRAIADMNLLKEMNTARADDTITEEEYKRKKSTLYLPAHGEIITILNAVTKSLVKPAGVDELPENDTPPEPADTTRQDEIEAAIKTGDPLKIHAAMYPGATSPDASRTQEQAPSPK